EPEGSGVVPSPGSERFQSESDPTTNAGSEDTDLNSTEPSARVPSEAAVASTQEDPEALLARLDAELAQGDSIVGTISGMRLYGFADFSVYKYFLHEDSAFRTLLYPRSAFAVGKLNLYLATELGEGWQSLIEVRFAYLPNGSKSVDSGEVVRTDTSVQDYTNPAQ